MKKTKIHVFYLHKLKVEPIMNLKATNGKIDIDGWNYFYFQI
jgi:hypothetical protein